MRQGATQDEIERAARVANAHEFIEQLQHGYRARGGDRGARLSGGQTQRIAIAFLKDLRILILDEATSALDAVSEEGVRAAPRRPMTGRTTIIIVHRVSTIHDADRIVVVDRGRIQAVGTHQDLVAGRSLYARLYSTQFGSVGAGREVSAEAAA